MADADVKDKPKAPKKPPVEKVEDKRRAMVRVQAGPLAAALKEMASIAVGGGTVPILSNVMLEAGNGMLRMTTTDLDMWLTNSIGIESGDWLTSTKDFVATVPAKLLAAIAAAADSQATIDIEVMDGYGRAQIKYARSTFKLPTLPPTDFPPVPTFAIQSSFEIDAVRMLDAMASVDHAISTEETRYYLNGIYVHPSGLDFKFAATDGNRLACLTMDVPEGGASFPPDILPRKTVALLEKLLAPQIKAADDAKTGPALLEVDSGGSKSKLRFLIGNIELVTKMIDGQFPDYTKVIPDGATCETAIVPRAKLIEAVKSVRLLSSTKDSCVAFAFTKDRIGLRVASPENGEALDEVSCVYEGAEMTIGFNGKFLIELLDAFAHDNVVLSFSEPSLPMMVKGSGDDTGRFVQVIMPMRV